MSDLMQPPISISLPAQIWAGILQVLKTTRGYTHQELDPLIRQLEQGLQVGQRPMPQVPLTRPQGPPVPVPQDYGPMRHPENST